MGKKIEEVDYTECIHCKLFLSCKVIDNKSPKCLFFDERKEEKNDRK